MTLILTPAEQARVCKAVLTHPRQMGLHFSNWTAGYACLYARVRFRKDVSSRTMVRVLRRHDMAPLRPRPIPSQGDEKLQQRFLDTMRGSVRRALPREPLHLHRRVRREA